MKLRALVFEDEQGLRDVLVRILKRRGYEVVAFEHPGLCPVHIRLGCKIRNVALMSGAWELPEINRAHQLGASVFNKPFSVKDLNAWLDECEKNIEPGRALSDLFAPKPS